ncbi:hypothetical protein [Paenibacillus tianjinensis]|uniref:Uncharacterized protein n=1 Tax=Paenibacillus tianjinensis TaxID=2810347 RepID=A0ABX7L5V9_9BACL|nr:hypothetical protein [Paenibacillus tianjinensis]QSF43497.1 hypothetical protein JRJ22_19740 [Paenibacillus tianjinensis]
MGIKNVSAKKYTKGKYYSLKVGFSDEYNIYEKALFRGETQNGELIFWDGGTSDGLIVLLHCNILESTSNEMENKNDELDCFF